jgi:transposase InsO family protein
MDERMCFIAEWRMREWPFAVLCKRFGISRKTGYKWLNRYEREGVAGLADRSRAPASHPCAVAPKVEERIVDFRRQHQTWGPRKLLARLARIDGATRWPCASTVAGILKRHGLSAPRKRKRHAAPFNGCLSPADGANDVWAADFKGWFRTGDGARCEPLTVTDEATRFIIRCQGLCGETGFKAVAPLFLAAFREFGMPRAIRTDNGPPFATTGLGGLSPLAVWWIDLGVSPERIEPGKPQQNGRHERMHRTLKAETASPPAKTLRAQQEAFDRFRAEFNDERPHEGLDMRAPGSVYVASERPVPQVAPPTEWEYPGGWATRKVRPSGQMKWHGRDVRITSSLVGRRVGLEPIDDGVWIIHYRDHRVGVFEETCGRAKNLPAGEKSPRGCANLAGFPP